MLQRKTALTPYDRDCLILLSCCTHLCGHAKPGSHWLESTPFYRRGRELRDAVYGPIIPCHLDPEYPNRTMASIYFEAIHGRVPKPGDILRYEEVAEMYKGETIKAEVERVQSAWSRRLPEALCPFRFEGGKILIHQDDGTWKLDWLGDVARIWSDIEDDAFDRDPCPYPPRAIPDQPTIGAVIFVESKDGKRRVIPLEAEGTLPGPESQAASLHTAR